MSENKETDNNQEDLVDIKSETEETISHSVVTPIIENGFLSSQEKLADIKKEWEDAKQRDLVINQDNDTEEGMPEPKISNDDEYSYPFGGWTNADNYNK